MSAYMFRSAEIFVRVEVFGVDARARLEIIDALETRNVH